MHVLKGMAFEISLKVESISKHIFCKYFVTRRLHTQNGDHDEGNGDNRKSLLTMMTTTMVDDSR